eukprot:CFRG3771T1
MLRLAISRTARFATTARTTSFSRSLTRVISANNFVRNSAPTSALRAGAFQIAPSRYYSATNDDGRDIKAKIAKVVKENKIVVFMKGVPDAPQCGFSNAVSQILAMHGLKDYVSFNILDDQELRQAVKEFSDWPTIPQVYINGEFVGGCDIILDLHKSGELINVLAEAGIKSEMPTDE